jgi:hypothetical protein|tara:strand:- start:448 stop:1104 length:657 start_codon:yes stop_codon:yes gene_type:complete
MKKLISILFIVSSFAFSQGYDFQQLCLDCAAQNGFYCGDDPANWTQYSPNGCVPNGAGGLEYLNDGWDDCVNGADEDGAVPTSPEECAPPMEECDTIFVEIPLIQYEYIYQIDTITEIEVVIQTETEYIYVTDTVYADVLDTMFIDVIEYVEIFVIDTIVQIETEYLDCETGLPCNSGMQEIINKSTSTGLMYNLQGQAIRKPEGIYIEEGKVKYKIY